MESKELKKEDMPTFVSISVAAKTLNVSKTHVRTLVKKGIMPSYQFGKAACRIRHEDLFSYIEKSKNKKEK